MDVKGAYDMIISLGSWCGPSVNLRQRQRRRFSFPLDWMISSSISDVTSVIELQELDWGIDGVCTLQAPSTVQMMSPFGIKRWKNCI
ncbi:DUF1796 family putative cysteine peptidase [Paenibacillus sp. GM2FR]